MKDNVFQIEYKHFETVFIQPHPFKPQEQLLDFYVRKRDTLKAKQVSSKILKTPIKVESEEVFRIKQKARAFLAEL